MNNKDYALIIQARSNSKRLRVNFRTRTYQKKNSSITR